MPKHPVVKVCVQFVSQQQHDTCTANVLTWTPVFAWLVVMFDNLEIPNPNAISQHYRPWSARTHTSVLFFLQLDKASLEAMLTLKTVPKKTSRAFGATRHGQNNVPDVWEGDLAVGRAKIYLVGNPFAEAGTWGGLADPHLQVKATIGQ